MTNSMRITQAARDGLLVLGSYQDFVAGPSEQSTGVLGDIGIERLRQNKKWGEQHHTDGTGPDLLADLTGCTMAEVRDILRDLCDREHKAGRGTWRHILLEEVFEALAEEDWAKLRTELIQSAAVIVAWVEDGDSRCNCSDEVRDITVDGSECSPQHPGTCCVCRGRDSRG